MIEKGQLWVSLKVCVFAITMKKVIIAVNKYAAVWVYTKFIMVIGTGNHFVQSHMPQRGIMMRRSSTLMILSVLKRCSPARFDRKYWVNDIKN